MPAVEDEEPDPVPSGVVDRGVDREPMADVVVLL